ncbi:MAG: N-acylneuraminate cytidylyltransferase [Lachnospiraceae bacterium]|nr:N-acylneuraminate cytidylyltransferase [Lachnospiraceae bacterium]
MNIAFIPVRGGSKSIPLKNIKPIHGEPLVYWTVRAACECKDIDKVYVVTDSDEIADVVKAFRDRKERGFGKLEVVGRTAESATDTASTEFAMLEFAKKYDFDNIVLIQATSPLLMKSDLEKGFDIFKEELVDSVLSVVRQKRFNWNIDDFGYAYPENYDFFNRPRRQDFDGYFVENGAFYITSRTLLLKSKNRISGNIKVIEMNEDSFFEIDELSDWVIAENLMQKHYKKCSKKISEIRMFLTDCDGCLTDAGMYYSEKGDELKKFNTHDGMGFALLRERGIITGIITSEKVELNQRRAKKMKLDILEEGCQDKLEVVERLCQKYQVNLENLVYIGDDVNDLEVIKNVGYSCCPSDALPIIKKHVDYITTAKGGEGVIREVVEKLIDE